MALFFEEFVGMSILKEGLRFWMASADENPTGDKKDSTPGKYLGRDEEDDGGQEEEQVESGGESFIREVSGWSDEVDCRIVYAAEIFHGILQISHVSPEIFAQFWRGLDVLRGCHWRTGKRIDVRGQV